jgi:hypothetical protein
MKLDLVTVGSIVGLLTGIFTVFDRFVSGRPLVSIRRVDKDRKDIHCLNTSKQDISSGRSGLGRSGSMLLPIVRLTALLARRCAKPSWR